jgi:hypothetical protein
MNMGGMTGMHKMPDGTMMKDSEHKMATGGKIKTKKEATESASTNLPGKSEMGKSRTALERTSPKSVAALSDLEAKQEELAMRNMLRDELGSKLDDPNFRVEMGGKEVEGLKKGGKVRGCGVAQRGLTKGRMV